MQEDVVQAGPGQAQVVEFDAAALEDRGDPSHVPEPTGLRGQPATAPLHVHLRRVVTHQRGRLVEVRGGGEGDHDAGPACLVLELRGGARGDDLALVDHHDLVGQVVGLLQVLGGQDQGGALVHQLAEHRPQPRPALRVQPGRRLVEEQDGRRGQQADRQVEPAAHAPRIGLGHPVGGMGEVEAVEEPFGGLDDVLPGQPVERPDEPEVLAAGEELVDGRRLAGEPHAAADLVGLPEDVEAGHPPGAARGHAQRGQHPHERRLARAVGAREAEDGAGRDDEADVVHGPVFPELLDQFDGLDRRGRGHAVALGVDLARLSGVMGSGCRSVPTRPQGLFALGATARPVEPGVAAQHRDTPRSTP